jgi:sigma-B regulation protein RsbQ
MVNAYRRFMIALSTPIARKLGARSYGDSPETLLFLNGFGTEQAVWEHQVRRFATAFNVITFDHVGSGHSDVSAYSAARYTSLYDYADDVLALIDELQLEDVSLVGHSAGAMVAAVVAVAAPSVVRRLVMIGASPRYLNDGAYVGGFDAAAIQGMLTAMQADYHAWATRFSKVVAANPERPQLADTYSDYLRAMRPDIAQATLKTIFNSDMRGILAQILPPTLLVQASEDAAVPREVGEYLASHIPRAELCEIGYTGHLPHMLEPTAIGDLIEDFLIRADTRPESV